MKRATVVFESMFGNTEAIARAIADGLATGMWVDVIAVGNAPSGAPSFCDLIVVGGPTHAFGMSRANTRRDAIEKGAHPEGSGRIGLREWLAGLDKSPAGVAAATFDTRIKVTGMPGSAARGAERRLRRLGFHLAAPAESFYVKSTEGPLLAAELIRARDWGIRLAAQFAAPDTSRVAS